MKKYIVGAVLISACACTPKGMPLDEQIAAVKACKESGGRPEEIRYVNGHACAKVNCYFTDKDTPSREREGKPCIDSGGVPIYSWWDGSLKDCKFKGVK